MNKGIGVGDTVRSKVNTIYDGTYEVVKTNKTTCWVVANENYIIEEDGKRRELTPKIYKGVRYSILEKA